MKRKLFKPLLLVILATMFLSCETLTEVYNIAVFVLGAIVVAVGAWILAPPSKGYKSNKRLLEENQVLESRNKDLERLLEESLKKETLK